MAGLEALVAMGNRQGTNIQWVWQLAEVCAQLSFSGIWTAYHPVLEQGSAVSFLAGYTSLCRIASSLAGLLGGFATTLDSGFRAELQHPVNNVAKAAVQHAMDRCYARGTLCGG